MNSRPRLRYIELLTGQSHSGPAWIAFANSSKSGAQLYFNGKALARIEGSRHIDTATQELYWASVVKKDGKDRHWSGSGKVSIEKGAIASYLRFIGATELDASRFDIIEDLPPTDASQFSAPAAKQAPDSAPNEPES